MDNQKKNIAVVIGDWHFNSLGIVRSLGEQGVPVVYINLSDGGYAEDSKYTIKTYHAKSQEEVLESILSIIDEFGGKPVLFPASDIAALWIDNLFFSLKEKAYCPGFEGKMIRFMDKETMGAFAGKAGFIVPESKTFEINDQAKNVINEFKIPFIIKPLKSVDGLKDDIKICKSKKDLIEIINWLNSDECRYSELLIQEFICGEKNTMIEYCGCKLSGSKTEIYGQLEKIREYPINRGSTTYAVIKEKITYIDVSVLDRFLEEVHFSGIFDLELKLVDNKPYFLEINFRNGAPSYAFTVAGFNIPFTWYNKIQNLEIQKPGIKKTFLMSERDDLRNVTDKNISVFKWIRCVRNTDTMMIYNKKDPAPFSKNYNRLNSFIFFLLQK